MIRLKNRSEEVLQVTVPGNASTGAKFSFLVPYAVKLKAIYAKVRTAGTTGTMHIDIQKNGTSIFSGATKVDFATGVTAATYGALSTDPTSFAKGDIITINITAVHTTPSVDLGMLLTLQRTKQSGPGATETDTVGFSAE